MALLQMSLDKYAIFCAPALHFADTMSDFAAAAEFYIIQRDSTDAQCSYGSVYRRRNRLRMSDDDAFSVMNVLDD